MNKQINWSSIFRQMANCPTFFLNIRNIYGLRVSSEYQVWDIQAGLIAVTGSESTNAVLLSNGRTIIRHLALKFLTQKEEKEIKL